MTNVEMLCCVWFTTIQYQNKANSLQYKVKMMIISPKDEDRAVPGHIPENTYAK